MFTELGEPFSWGLFTASASAHGLSTMLMTALIEVSNARLEEQLSSPEEVSLYNELLQDDHETIADLATLQAFFLAAAGLTLGWIQWRSPIDSVLDYASTLGAFLALILVFHTIPRTFGDRFAEGIVIRFAPRLWLLRLLGRVITQPSRWASLVALRIAGLADSEDATEEADDEIRSAAIEAVREGVLEQSALNMIERVIDFRDVEVTEVMTPRIDIIGLENTAKFDDAIEVMIKHGLSRVPIYEESIDRIIGVVHVKDAVQALHEHQHSPPGEGPELSLDALQRKPLFVPESKRVRDLFGEVKRNKMHVAIVVDEYGGTSGLVTMSDIIKEIFGDIADEHTEPEPETIEQLANDRFLVEGKVHIDELNEKFNFNIPEDDDYDTVGGFLSAKLSKIPSVGETFEHERLQFTVLEADERRVYRVEIRVMSAANG